MRLERLVGDVLDLAKLDAHRFTVLEEEVDMRELCERAFAAFGEVARQRSIDYRGAFPVHPVIVTDGDRVLQIISNLLSNAFRLDAGGRPGRARARRGQREHLRRRLRFRAGRLAGGATHSPFWSRDGGGTGLGLAIARARLALGRPHRPAQRAGARARFGYSPAGADTFT